jgi:hypothetical protein
MGQADPYRGGGATVQSSQVFSGSTSPQTYGLSEHQSHPPFDGMMVLLNATVIRYD